MEKIKPIKRPSIKGHVLIEKLNERGEVIFKKEAMNKLLPWVDEYWNIQRKRMFFKGCSGGGDSIYNNSGSSANDYVMSHWPSNAYIGHYVQIFNTSNSGIDNAPLLRTGDTILGLTSKCTLTLGAELYKGIMNLNLCETGIDYAKYVYEWGASKAIGTFNAITTSHINHNGATAISLLGAPYSSFSWYENFNKIYFNSTTPGNTVAIDSDNHVYKASYNSNFITITKTNNTTGVSIGFTIATNGISSVTYLNVWKGTTKLHVLVGTIGSVGYSYYAEKNDPTTAGAMDTVTATLGTFSGCSMDADSFYLRTYNATTVTRRLYATPTVSDGTITLTNANWSLHKGVWYLLSSNTYWANPSPFTGTYSASTHLFDLTVANLAETKSNGSVLYFPLTSIRNVPSEGGEAFYSYTSFYQIAKFDSGEDGNEFGYVRSEMTKLKLTEPIIKADGELLRITYTISVTE